MEHEHSFSIREALKFGWETFKQNSGFFIRFLLVAAVLTFGPLYLHDYFAKAGKDGLAAFFFVVYYVLSLMVGLGFTKICLDYSSGGAGDISDLVSQFPKTWKSFFSGLLYNIIVTVGVILLLFPAFIWAVKYLYYPFFIVDKNAGPIEALEMSSKLTYGSKWQLFKLLLLSFLLNLAGAMLFVVGLIVTLPLTTLAYAYVYRRLEEKLSAQESV